MTTRRRLIGFLGGALGVAVTANGVRARNIASTVRLHDHGSHTRLVVELSEATEFKIFSLADPHRIVVDLPEIAWEVSADDAELIGVIRDLRYGLFQPGQSRMVLDLGSPAVVERAFLLNPTSATPWRFVLDLVPVSENQFRGQAGPSNAILVRRDSLPSTIAEQPKIVADAAGPTADSRVPLPHQKPPLQPSNRKPVIALDPGHGGVDPGAIGISGVREKDITLAAARELKKALEKTGHYKVVLTRNRDVSLGLRQRIAIARRAAADVFISLHADSIGRADVRGLSVYTLSEKASDREAAALAVKENKADLIIGMDLTSESADVRNILVDLARRESLNLAAHLAAILIRELKRQVKLLRNTHRFAGFAVLKAPDVPSVLLEMGYLSNREDERALRQPAYRQRLAGSIVQAMDGYFAERDVIRPT